MRSADTKENIQQQIDILTERLDALRADLNTLVEHQQQQESPVGNNRGTNKRHQFDQNGTAIYVGDTVLFRPTGTRSGSTQRTRGIIVRFTAQRVYIRRANDKRLKPQEILRDPAHTQLVTN